MPEWSIVSITITEVGHFATIVIFGSAAMCNMLNQSPFTVFPGPSEICLEMESLLIESDVCAEVERSKRFNPEISFNEMNIKRCDLEAKV